jgi:hypothetical protein
MVAIVEMMVIIMVLQQSERLVGRVDEEEIDSWMWKGEPMPFVSF